MSNLKLTWLLAYRLTLLPLCLISRVIPVCANVTPPGRCASGCSNVTGDVMPQNGMNYEGRRGGTRHNACKANGQVPGTGLVNGAVVHNGCPADATRTSERTPAGTLNGTKPQCMVDGYINQRYKGRSTKAAPPRTIGRHGSTISAVTDASAAGRVHGAGTPGGISVYGDTGLDTVALPCKSDQMAPQPSLSAAAKIQRRRPKFRHKKRDTEVVHPVYPTRPLMPPQEKEDWESEIQEVTKTDWGKFCFGDTPYGPQDVLHFDLRDLTLKQRDTVDLPVTANYNPAVHHPHPVKWSCYSIPTETDQFADADDGRPTGKLNRIASLR
ncbi:uncharacterized protein LOC114565382 isoform X2 [Perca flavescens]|uniref:uncharacterized protein LOC114565382 isoform X2 n=1 Tax=Perca flavescens TaxID=8167 RepID=UPI00106E71C4|nr:uncharacterized protein LOC114565382 isoform X2 [Perca flavescens]